MNSAGPGAFAFLTLNTGGQGAHMGKRRFVDGTCPQAASGQACELCPAFNSCALAGGELESPGCEIRDFE